MLGLVYTNVTGVRAGRVASIEDLTTVRLFDLENVVTILIA